MSKTSFIHPYMPSSDPRQEALLLQELGIRDADELYAVIPEAAQMHSRLSLPDPFVSEQALERHVRGILARNVSCRRNVSFLGAGCWQHYIPAACDEIANRAEFKTAYGGPTYQDKGKYQAMFEYMSMMGELLDFDLVSCPTYDWSSAASSALLMTGRITGRGRVLVASTIGHERLQHMHNFCTHALEIVTVQFDPATGLMDLDDLAHKLSDDVAGVYFENPSYLGFLEANAAKITALAHKHGALAVVGVDPISLGVIAPPPSYGADICVGDVQPLGNAMNCGGNASGFIASRDEDRFLREYPTTLYSIAPGRDEGDFGFNQCTPERTSYTRRDKSPDFIGTSTWLPAMTAGVYLALMGPQGIRDLGETILQRRTYAQQLLAGIPGVDPYRLTATPFKEFVVSFDGTGRTVADINHTLLKAGIFGGKDVSAEYPALGQSALYCVTEIHTAEDIERLCDTIKEAVQ